VAAEPRSNSTLALLFHLGKANKIGARESNFFNIASKAPRRDHRGLLDEDIKSPSTLGEPGNQPISHRWFRNRHAII